MPLNLIMISTLRKNLKKTTSTLLLGGLLFVLLPSQTVLAQETLTLSVTPTLFEMSAEPGQVWNSSIKVANPNQYKLTVYPSVVNFAPQGERGMGKFLPVFDTGTSGATLAEWITVSPDPVVIEREKSAVIPISVVVPPDAAPGGHFAAILVGTKPPEATGELAVRTSQMVTSLFFVRIAGDVIEEGTIRSFRAANSFVDAPQADFELRFENKGNVHLQPQGTIIITNMWGEERGRIPINHDTHFGNVLPDSVRNFEFSWSSAAGFSEIGRYKAVATLAYGRDARNFQTREIAFWVVPVKEVLLTIALLVAIAWFVSWVVKAYIRRMLILSGINPDDAKRRARVQRDVAGAHTVELRNYRTISAPVRSGWLDLRQQLETVKAVSGYMRVLGQFAWQYRLFFIGIIGFMVIGVIAWWYAIGATASRDYQVTIGTEETAVTLTAEEIYYNQLRQVERSPLVVTQSTSTPISVVNVSGENGTAAQVRLILEKAGYVVTDMGSDSERNDRRTVVVYSVDVQQQAAAISRELDGALLSASTGSSTNEIIIYAGQDSIVSE